MSVPRQYCNPSLNPTGMAPEKAGSRLVGIIFAAVVLALLLGVIIYLAWRDQNPKPKAVSQPSAAVSGSVLNTRPGITSADCLV